jgi:uncharacterized protein YndB with AHSA1/START domain
MLLERDWEIVVDKPVDEVFAAFAERAGRVPAWGDSPEVAQVRKLTEGPVGAGSRYLLSAEHRGRHAEGTVEVTDYDPDQAIKIAWSGEFGGHWEQRFGAAGIANFFYSPRWATNGTIEARLTEHQSGTKIDMHGENNLSGWARPASLIMRWFAYRRINGDLARFKSVVESARD